MHKDQRMIRQKYGRTKTRNISNRLRNLKKSVHSILQHFFLSQIKKVFESRGIRTPNHFLWYFTA